MASTKKKAHKAPILEDETTEINDLEEVQSELDIKGKPLSDSKTSQSLPQMGLEARKGEVSKTQVLASSSALRAAGNANGENKMPHVGNDIVASTTSIKTESSLLQKGKQSNSNKSSAKLGMGWVSFEDESVRKSDQGTPRSMVVNGDLDHQTGEATVVMTQDNTDKVFENATGRYSSQMKQEPNHSEAKSSNLNGLSSRNTLTNGHSQNLSSSSFPSSRGAEGDPSSPSWVTFEDSDSKGVRSDRVHSSGVLTSAPTMGVPATSSSPQPNWVTFDERGKQRNTTNVNLSVNVSIADQSPVTPSTPSPNPFVNAPMSIVTPKPPSSLFPSQSPLTVVTSTNPFHSGEGLSTAHISPYPIETPQSISQLQQPARDPSKWIFHDVSVLEHGFKADDVVAQPIDVVHVTPPAELRLALTGTAVDHIDAGIVAVAEAVNEDKPAVLELSDDESLGEDFSLATTNTSWSLLLRYPDKKKKISSREWKAVVIKLEGNTLQIYEEYELSAPFREIPLQSSFSFDPLKLQPSGRHGKVHTTKLMYLNYKETRSVRQKGTFEHVAEGMSIIKIGSGSHIIMREFIEAVGNSIRALPAYRDRGITYRKDEMFVDIDDTCYALVSGDGSVKKKGGHVAVKIRAFLTGDPECQLVLNDAVVKEREEARLRGELKPQRVHHWIRLRDCSFHKCVSENCFDESHAIIFHPLDACTFELMQFRVKQSKPLPLSVKASLIVHSEQRIELRAEIKLCQDTKMSKYSRNNVTFRLPIPETWVPLFRTGGFLGREKSIKSSKGKRAAGIKSRLKHSRCSIAASLGTAQYEPEYSAVVWRIDKLPLIQSKIPVDAPQTLNCLLELPSGMECPGNYQPYAELEYDVSHVLLSDTTVIAVKVSNRSIPEKWVCYRALYQYHIDMVVHRPSSGPIKDVGCIQQ